MVGRAYVADTVTRDMKQLNDLLTDMASDYSCGNPIAEYVEKMEAIIESYLQDRD